MSTASRLSKRKEQRALRRKMIKAERRVVNAPSPPPPSFPRNRRRKVRLKLRIKWFINDIKRFIKDVIQDIKDKINPPKRCRLKYMGSGTMVWGMIPAKFYVCRDCGLEFFTSDMTPYGKKSLEAASRCSGKKSEEEEV